ncbi:MAG: uridine kinase [Candidatus Sericytochromatia bacterium]|nr:uridine kinase [Candidatus Sericytochromatia bacterium]
MSKIYVIGVAGGTGSGKSTIARNVVEVVGHANVTYIQQDSYYYDMHHLPIEVRSKLNYDHLDAIDNDLLIKHLEQLKHGKSIKKPIYDFKTHSRSPLTEQVPARKVILIEGILVLAHEKLREMMDIKIFVDTDADIRLIRRISRDVTERGRSLESVVDQYMDTVRPMHERFVEPCKKNADLIIPEGGHNEVAMDMLITKIKSLADKPFVPAVQV